MSLSKQERIRAILESQALVDCEGGWIQCDDGIVRCSACHSIHPEMLLAVVGRPAVKVRRVKYGRERIEFLDGVDFGMSVIFDSVHIPSFGQDKIVEVLDKLRSLTFMEWQFRSRTLSTVCWFESKPRLTKEEMDMKAEAQQYWIRQHSQGKQAVSILYPDAVHCLARSGES